MSISAELCSRHLSRLIKTANKGKMSKISLPSSINIVVIINKIELDGNLGVNWDWLV